MWKHKPATPEAIEASLQLVKHLCQGVRQRFKTLHDEGTMRPGDLDTRAVMNLQALPEPLQLKVLQHIERDRVVYFNSRSKSGYFMSACEKAKRGELDVRGYGSVDPWSKQMSAVCVSRTVQLVKEKDWFRENSESIDLIVNELDVDGSGSFSNSFKVKVNIKWKISDLKDFLTNFTKIPRKLIKLTNDRFHLKDERTLAFYNLNHQLTLQRKHRGGRRINKTI